MNLFEKKGFIKMARFFNDGEDDFYCQDDSSRCDSEEDEGEYDEYSEPSFQENRLYQSTYWNIVYFYTNGKLYEILPINWYNIIDFECKFNESVRYKGCDTYSTKNLHLVTDLSDRDYNDIKEAIRNFISSYEDQSDDRLSALHQTFQNLANK